MTILHGMRMFPTLPGARFQYIDFNAVAEKWLLARRSLLPRGSNPLLNSMVCEVMVGEEHDRLGVKISYGGYLEDRSTLWKGSYLEENKTFLHLGVDFQVPIGTPVAAVAPSTVLRIDSDFGEEHGWGTRLFLAQDSGDILLYAHAIVPNLRIGQRILPGDHVGYVADSDNNGGWFPHLHVQAIMGAHYNRLLHHDLRNLDGYGRVVDLHVLPEWYPNPFIYLTGWAD